MSKYYEVEVIVRVVLDDDYGTDEEVSTEAAYEVVADIMGDQHKHYPTGGALTGWSWAMLDDCVTEVGP